MGFTIKTLASGRLSMGVKSLYTAPNDLTTTPPKRRAAIITSIRFVNWETTASFGLTLAFRSRVAEIPTVVFSRPWKEVLPGFELIDDDELTMSPGDSIQCSTYWFFGVPPIGTPINVDYVVSGLEQDVSLEV